MTEKEKLEKFEQVNKCETFEELAEVILSFGDTIQGRNKVFFTKHMASMCRMFDTLPTPNYLTREFGIRQQALYIQYYEKKERE